MSLDLMKNKSKINTDQRHSYVLIGFISSKKAISLSYFFKFLKVTRKTKTRIDDGRLEILVAYLRFIARKNDFLKIFNLFHNDIPFYSCC